MADLVVIVPSRGRPHTVAEIAEALDATSTASTNVLFVVDADDPTRADYFDAVAKVDGAVDIVSGEHRNMGDALNQTAVKLAGLSNAPFAIGFCGDDHRFRSKAFDQSYLDALRELGTGIVYGNDLLQGERIPTQVAMTSDIVRALGHMAPPPLVHLDLDTYWKELGERAGCLRYLPDVIVEHVHPIAAGLPFEEWDEGHQRVNTKEMYATDRAAYTRWKYMQLPAEVAKVKALRKAPVV